MAVLLSVAACCLWGVSDFMGGTASRRIHPFAVAGAMVVLTYPLLIVAVLATGSWHAMGAYLGWGALAGLVGSVSLAVFFEALATGVMGLVAPIGATGVLLPVVAGIILGERPSPAQLIGIVAALGGVVLASGPEFGALRGHAAVGGLRPVLLAAAAAVGFGIGLFAIAEGSRTSVGMTLVAAHTVHLVIALAVAAYRRSLGGLGRGDIALLTTAGTLDLVGVTAYMVATESALIAVVAVISTSYPVVTLLLARRLHDERLTALQWAGVSVTMTGVLLLAL